MELLSAGSATPAAAGRRSTRPSCTTSSPVFLCPSENVSGPAAGRRIAALNYVGNIGGPGAIQSFSGTMISAVLGQQHPGPLDQLHRVAVGHRRDLEHRALQRAADGRAQQPHRHRRATRTTPSGPSSSVPDLGGRQRQRRRRGDGRPQRLQEPPRHDDVRLASYRSGQIWTIGHPWATIWNRYFHFGPPNMHSCDTSPSHVRRGSERRPGGRPADEQPPRRRQRLLHRRLGQVHQGHRLPSPTWWALGTRAAAK